MGDGKTILISHIGSTQLCASNYSFQLSNALYAPAIKINLILISQFCHDNLTLIEFFSFKFFVKDLNMRASLVCSWNKDGLYEWPSGTAFTRQHPQSNLVIRWLPLYLWHRRLGHPNSCSLKTVSNNFSLPYCNSNNFNFFNSCCCNKIHRLPFSTNTLQSFRPLQTLYNYLWGPYPVLSVDKKLYYVIFVDQYTKYIWLYTLKNKNKVHEIFKNFQPLIERHFQTKIHSFYTDGGGEFEGLKSYLSSQGIEHLVSPPYIPQRVAIAERRHSHIIETTKTLLHQASLPSKFWILACQQATYLINRLPTPIYKINVHTNFLLNNHQIIHRHERLAAFAIPGLNHTPKIN